MTSGTKYKENYKNMLQLYSICTCEFQLKTEYKIVASANTVESENIVKQPSYWKVKGYFQ